MAGETLTLILKTPCTLTDVDDDDDDDAPSSYLFYKEKSVYEEETFESWFIILGLTTATFRSSIICPKGGSISTQD